MKAYGGALRVIPAETRLTVYRRRPVEFREDFSHELEMLGGNKIGLRCELSYGMSEKVRGSKKVNL